MKRKTLVRIHIAATITAVLTIVSFFISSLIAEISGDETIIRNVKEAILFLLPLLLVAMPASGITGSKLAGKSQNRILLLKKKRMIFIFINGVTLIALACFLYYRSHHQTIDGVFWGAQVAEFVLGLTNLILIGLNIRSGFQLSGRLKKVKLAKH
jgi:hypothetical protein